MDVLLREIRTRGDGRTEYVDTELSGAAFTIGTAPDSVVQLLGEGIGLAHAEIAGSPGAFRLAAVGRGKIVVNGKQTASHRLAVGDVIEIGGHRLRIFEAPAGFDLGIELSRDATVAPGAYESAFRTELAGTWLGKRRPAWLLLLTVVGFTLAVPLAVREWQGEANRMPWLPSDAMWSSGPLLPAHQLAVGDDCSICHARLFERVQDAACRDCHEGIADHFEPELAVAAAADRCARCHREHNEPGTLVVTADGLCTDCHREEQPAGAGGRVESVTGFGADSHPPFDAHLLKSVTRAGGTGFVFEWRDEVVTVEAATAGALERSNLEFPHDVHLDGAKVRSARTSEPLGCGDCHALSADLEHFRPVTMEHHCSSCHDLKFDDTDPERQLPHGEPIEAVLAIEGHFLRKFSDPDGARAEREQRRLPDRVAREERCTGAAFECASRRTLAEALNQFTVRGCVTCHAVEDNGNRDVYSRFQVLPIRLVADYFPDARFDHRSHLTSKDARGDAACRTCHAAATSNSSADLLIPDRDTCTECHADANTDVRAAGTDRVVLGCIECHAYHPGATAVDAAWTQMP